jgi:hypothetical protein
MGGPWTSFLVAVQFLLVFPLLPLGAELAFTGKINASSLMLVASTYAISLSTSSVHVGRWAFGIMVGIIFSGLFGWTMGLGDDAIGPAYVLGGSSNGIGWLWVAGVGIGIIFGTHLWERVTRHIHDQEPFPEFLKGGL